MKKIAIDWAPNAQRDDLLLAVSLLLQPWKWSGNKFVKELESEFSKYIGQEVLAFDSARSALYCLLKSLGIKENDEVLLQAYTCVALPNPILWVGAKPVYVDVDLSNFNIDIEDLESKITPNSKAVIVQYTFGFAPDMQRVLEICQKNKLILIEDCCHNLGQRILISGQKKMAGTIGDMAIFSLGMEKVISATRGGLATINPNTEILKNRFQEVYDNLKIEQSKLKQPRTREILRGLFNPLTYRVRQNWESLGEAIYKFMNKIKLHDLGLTYDELIGKKARWLPYFMPNTNAILGLNQLQKIEKFNQQREELAQEYSNKLKQNIVEQGENINSIENKLNQFKLLTPDMSRVNQYAKALWLRYPLIVQNPDEILSKGKLNGIHLGNWYNKVIHGKGVDLEALEYKLGSCPKADWLIRHSINLPTHQGINSAEINAIIKFLNS